MSQFIEVTLRNPDDFAPKTQHINVRHILRYGENQYGAVLIWLTDDTMFGVKESIYEIYDAIREGDSSNDE